MRRRNRVRVAVAALIAAAAGCSYPTFSYGPGNGGSSGGGMGTTASSGIGGAGTTSSGGTGGSGGATADTSSSTSASSSTGGPTCAIPHLLISEVRSRGPMGASDEFVELFNPTSAPVTLDANWVLEGRTVDSNITDYSTRWVGSGKAIPSLGHYLIVGTGFADGVPHDDKLNAGITDAASLRLSHAGQLVDAVCYYHTGDLNQLGALVNPITFYPYTCEGAPMPNPHDDTTGTNVDSSIERKPGGALGNCTDGGDNSTDFVTQSPSTPLGSQSP